MANNKDAPGGAQAGALFLIAIAGGVLYLIVKFFAITWEPIQHEIEYRKAISNYNSIKEKFSQKLKEKPQYLVTLNKHPELLQFSDLEAATLTEETALDIYCGRLGDKGMQYKRLLFANDYLGTNVMASLVVCENGGIYRYTSDPIYQHVQRSIKNFDYNKTLYIKYGETKYNYRKWNGK